MPVRRSSTAASTPRPRRLVAEQGVDRLELTEEGLVIGAMATVNQVARHEGIARLYPGIVDAATSLAAEQVRNQATVGGNIAHADPASELAAVSVAIILRTGSLSRGRSRCGSRGDPPPGNAPATDPHQPAA